MLDFDAYISRHGEHGVQAIIERLERNMGVRGMMSVPLQDRWDAVMGEGYSQAHRQRLAA